MRRRSVLVLGGILSLLGAPVWAASDTDVVQSVQQRFDATSDLTAAVDQELVVASAGKTLQSKGTVAFKRPGKMRWSLTNGSPQIIVADGTTLWFYQPDEQQVLKAPFQAAFRSSTPISFLTGVGRLTEDFEVTRDGEAPGVIYLALKPRKGEGDLGRLRLTIDDATHDIVGAEITDPVGNVTRLRFSNLQRNSGLDDAQFRFEIPDGVDVIEAPIGN
jgi:outer membrane lipoprotein carrier protein